jgi:hypothetical protein
MSKKNWMLALLALFVLPCYLGAAEKNTVKFSKSVLKISEQGGLTLYIGKKLLMNFRAHFTTRSKEKWISYVSAKAGTKLLSADGNSWRFEGNIPLNNTARFAVKQSLTLSPGASLDGELVWNKLQTPDDLREAALFVTLPMAAAGKSKITINGKNFSKTLDVVNDNKFGWFRGMVKNPEILLLDGIAPVKIACAGTFYVTIGSVKNREFTLRIVAPRSANGIQFSISE